MIFALRVITSFLLFVFTNEVVARTIFNQTEILLLFSEQDTSIDNAEKEKVIIIDPESPPTFKDGGDAGMQKFIQENLKYPQGETANGTVYVNVTVDATGEGKDYTIAKGLSPTTNQEALRVVKLMKFNPGTFNGIPKEMKLRIPIKFEVVHSMEQAPLFKGGIVDTIIFSSNCSAFHFDGKGTTTGTHEEYIIVIDKFRNEFILQSHKRIEYTITIKPDSIATRTKVFKERDEIGVLEIADLLRQCELWYVKPSFDQIGISIEEFEKLTDRRHIKQMAGRYKERWQFRRRYSSKEENEKLFRGCQSLDSLNLYLSLAFDTTGYTVVTDLDDSFRITISTSKENFIFEGKYPNTFHQPWYMFVGDEYSNMSTVLNLGLNREVVKILPRDFSRIFTLTPETLIDDYIQWYLKRRGVLIL